MRVPRFGAVAVVSCSAIHFLNRWRFSGGSCPQVRRSLRLSGLPFAGTIQLWLARNGERYKPSPHFLQRDACISASQRVGFNPWLRTVEELFGTQPGHNDKPES